MLGSFFTQEVFDQLELGSARPNSEEATGACGMKQRDCLGSCYKGNVATSCAENFRCGTKTQRGRGKTPLSHISNGRVERHPFPL